MAAHEGLAKRILGLPDEGKFEHRTYVHQTQWDDELIGTYAELKGMAREYLELVDSERKKRASMVGIDHLV